MDSKGSAFGGVQGQSPWPSFPDGPRFARGGVMAELVEYGADGRVATIGQ